MLQLTKKLSGCIRENHHIFLIFGVGLVGKAIARELKLQTPFLSSYKDFTWLDPLKQISDLKELEAAFPRSTSQVPNDISEFNTPRITFIWSAGACGFQSTEDELDSELVNFKNIVDFANKLQQSLTDFQVDFHMVSSSGALFEGQRSVTPFNTPMPRRPYGRLKLEQEQYLLQSDIRLGKSIYRTSSVYGHYHPSNRIGLIPIMLYNGVRNYTTQIYGSMDTIRDYIYVGDVSRFIVRESLSKAYSTEVKTHILASARPASIMNIKYLVESTIRKKIYLNYHPLPSVYAHNSFMPSVLPSNLSITSLETGIRLIYENLYRIM